MDIEDHLEMMEDGEVRELNESQVVDEEEDILEKSKTMHTLLDEEKLKKRAERFGVDPDTTKVKQLSKEEMRELYESFQLPDEEIKAVLESEGGVTSHTFHHRFEAIHVRGTEDMSTQDIFTYFKGYAPASIEWINDYSCNVVWLEAPQAAHAMLECSKHRVKMPATIVDADAMDDDQVEDPGVAVPPGVWRMGLEHPKAAALLLRFANRTDRKVKGAERMSKYYTKYGNPNFGGMVGLISSSRKRRMRGIESPVEDTTKNPWGSLAEAWGASETEDIWQRRLEDKRQVGTGLPSALIRRLGHHPPRPSPSRSRDTESDDSKSWRSANSDSDDSSSSSVEGRSRKKRPRMRMYADEEEKKGVKTVITRAPSTTDEDDHKDFGSKLAKLRTQTRNVHARLGPSGKDSPAVSSVDLRSRIGSAKPTISSMVVQIGRSSVTKRDEQGDHVDADLRKKLQSRLGTK